jgi:diguanylate cyclase (GGDEF)-like protein
MTPTTAPQAAPGPKPFQADALRVLLFEDSAMDAALVKKFLQTAGVRLTNIFHTDTIPSALQVLARENIDLCLTDYYLRPHTGFDLMDEVRRFDFNVPFIMLTGMDDRAVDEGALERGAYDFLVKGELTVEGLERSIRYTLNRHSRETVLTKAATCDGLTGLMNRAAFVDRLTGMIDDARVRAENVALLHINLNGMKHINETCSHKVGDDVLKAVAQKLNEARRPSDFVARLGGDDFAFIITDFLLPKHAIEISRKMIAAVTGHIPARDGDHHMIVAGGLVAETIRRTSPPTPELVERIMLLASRAMFEAKTRTRMKTDSDLVMGRLGHDRVN